MAKRLFDICASLAGLVVLSPLLVAVAALIKLDSPGPVFFRQARVGRNFTPFRIYKFRTMAAGADKNGPEITAGGDSRVTRVGRVLRKTKVDELPQLLNVLKGEMSIVGPRPEVGRYVKHYEEDYRDILSVRPGITDISSITFRDEEGVLRDKEDPEEYYRQVLLPEKMRLSRQYIQRASLHFDLGLILRTLLKLVSHDAPAGRDWKTPGLKEGGGKK